MKINEFEFRPDNHFVAMEYYWLILNRTFLILITDKELIGSKVHGPIGAESHDPIASLVPLTIDGDLENPYSYMSMKYIERIKDTDLKSNEFLKINSANFIIGTSTLLKQLTTREKNGEWDNTHMTARFMLGREMIIKESL